MLFAFVILHYGSADMTQQAIDSVESLSVSKNNDIRIVIVDNASPGKTGTIVAQKNANRSNFIFLKNEENIGFARGNNVGFKYAKEVLKADFIILMNNDAVIESKNFCEMVMNDFTNTQYAVLGPDIQTPSGRHQNPLRQQMLKGIRVKLTQAYLYLDLICTWLFLTPIFFRICKNRKHQVLQSQRCSSDNVELHGSFLIFSPLYIQKFDGLDDRTFMYCEEEFLFARCVKNGLKSRYNPEIKILHNESEGNQYSIGYIRKRRLFRIKNCIKSLKIYASTDWSPC